MLAIVAILRRLCFKAMKIRIRKNKTSSQHTREHVGPGSADLLGQAAWNFQHGRTGFDARIPAAPTSSSAPRPSVAKALQRAPGPVSAAITCLGIAGACSFCSPPPSVQGRCLMRRMRISTFRPIQPILSPFRQHHVMERFLLLFLPMRAFMCAFLEFAAWILSSGLRLIEHGASCAPCSILQADTLWPSFFSLFYQTACTRHYIQV